MHKPIVSIQDYTYQLPNDRIANYPLTERDQSKLLTYKNRQIEVIPFPALINAIAPQSLLVFNNTKVIQARLKFKKHTGAEIELFCLEPYFPTEVSTAFETTGYTIWKCIVGNARKWKQDQLIRSIEINNELVEVSAEKMEQKADAYLIAFRWNNDGISFAEIIEAIGQTPIPPYLNRESEALDTHRYQTVYSKHKGSVAAPTAGLHFTEAILESLKENNHSLLNITLHVGAGTFKPVKSETIAGHEMHTEHFVINSQTIQSLLNHKNQTIAVGTTTVRTLESLYWYGVRLLENLSIEEGIDQWDPYNLPTHYSKEMALSALENHLKKKNLSHLSGKTAIIIVPGYQFRMIDGLFTNFHQPQSTLLLLIAALIGEDWRKIYDYALSHNFRFLSYGDSSLLMKQETVRVVGM